MQKVPFALIMVSTTKMVSAIEVGVGLDFYTKKLAQMVYVNQRQTFLNAYIALVFGQRK
jgi:hypothetical protein